MARPEHNPDTPPIGRQGYHCHWTPSGKAPSPWFGTIINGIKNRAAQEGGERFTREQLYELNARGLDPETVETMTVKRQATQDEVWFARTSMPPVFAFDCPVIGKGTEGRIRVIAPGGPTKLVQPDGWAKPPRTRPERIW